MAFNGRVYEAICARRQHRRRAPLFHAALSLRLGKASYVIEMGPAWGNASAERGVVIEGPVGLPALRQSRLFRYEVRARCGTPNSLVAWLLLRSGHDLRHPRLPAQGRAPGWGSGISLALSMDDSVRAGPDPVRPDGVGTPHREGPPRRL